MKTARQFLLKLLLLAPLVAFETALAQPAAVPRIEGFDVQQVRRLVVGTELNFTVYGTPGARTSLQINGAERRVAMEETAPGTYEAVFVIGPRDTITSDGGVTVNLRVGNQIASAVLNEPLVRGARPEPPAPAAFLPRIDHFDVQPSADLRGGNELAFTIVGTPGGQANIAVAGNTTKFFLYEVKPGEYSGTYTIRNNDTLVANSVVVGTLRVGERVTNVNLDKSLMLPTAPVRRPQVCNACGSIEAINVVEVKGAGTYLGSFGGNRIQLGGSSTSHFEVLVRMERGGTETVSYERDPGFRVGEKVRMGERGLVRDQ